MEISTRYLVLIVSKKMLFFGFLVYTLWLTTGCATVGAFARGFAEAGSRSTSNARPIISPTTTCIGNRIGQTTYVNCN